MILIYGKKFILQRVMNLGVEGFLRYNTKVMIWGLAISLRWKKKKDTTREIRCFQYFLSYFCKMTSEKRTNDIFTELFSCALNDLYSFSIKSNGLAQLRYK